ncbi:Protein of unknown function DUF2339, transmembrane [Pseudodesulfovibrio mercurii]|uniref:DUF2339 domain-containing protein n=1 Tax=Pseudodesulfovibrio mercurii TaxID=641491 RepID=F0JII7_9BACT|nr:Protein of unknown function DUF2339, transmembrane [Pseudodesulfovibrio mercurii]
MLLLIGLGWVAVSIVLPIYCLVKVKGQSARMEALVTRLGSLEKELSRLAAARRDGERPPAPEPDEAPDETPVEPARKPAADFTYEASPAWTPAPEPEPQAVPVPEPKPEPLVAPVPEPQAGAGGEAMARRAAEPATSPFEPTPVEPAPVGGEVPEDATPARGMEWRLGARLPVWLGGAALILAGIFLVKYSIEQGLLGPLGRCILGGVFGAALQAAGLNLYHREGVVDRERMAMSLAGAGLAILYGTLYAASVLYGLIPLWLGFLGLAAVTAGAVLESLLMGEPIALLGMAGGFAAPLLVGRASPSPVVFFGYLILLHGGLLFICRRKGFFLTAVLSNVLVALWLGYWLVRVISPMDQSVLLGFILLDAGLIVRLLWQRSDAEVPDDKFLPSNRWSLLSIASVAFAVVLSSGMGHLYSGNAVNLIFLLVLAAGIMVLCWFQERTYLPAAYMAAVFLAVVGAEALPSAPSPYHLWLAAYAGVFCLGGILLLMQSETPGKWTPLVLGAGVAAFYLFHRDFGRLMPVAFWSAAASALGAVALGMAPRVGRLRDDPATRNAARAFAWVGGFGFLWAVAYGLSSHYEALGYAALIAAAALLWRWTREEAYGHLPLLPLAALAYKTVSLGILPWTITLFGATLHAFSRPYWLETATFSLLLPCVLVIGALVLVRDLPRLSRRGLEGAAGILLALSLAVLVRALASGGIPQGLSSLIENGLVTNGLFVAAFAGFHLARRSEDHSLNWVALGLAALAVWRVACLDVALNPWLRGISVGSVPVFNLLLAEYIPPIVWLSLLARLLSPLGIRFIGTGSRVFCLVLLFLLVTLEVRQVYHPVGLGLGATTDLEIFTYSVAWIVLAMAFLIIGTIRGNRMLRLASLCLMAPSVVKIFLYDASELTGLLRAFSFLGLGVCLILIGWFYSQFVFNDQPLNRETFKKSWRAFLPQKK